MIEVSGSILSVNKENAVSTFYDLETSKMNYFHIDVMDGKFVENNTIDLMKDYALTISHISNIGLDVHFMVEDVEEQMEDYLMLEPKIITFHIEAIKDKERIKNLINDIKDNNIKVGIAVSPETNIDEIKEFLPFIHMVLIMTVIPGKGGQKLIPETIDKVKKLKQYIDENNIDIDIEVDGGINLDNVELLKSAGANIIVVGSFLVSSENKKEVVEKIKQ